MYFTEVTYSLPFIVVCSWRILCIG